VSSLKQLSLQRALSNIAAGLTQLTSLNLWYGQAACLVHVQGLTQLQNLELGGPQYAIEPQELSPILAACKQLTSLTLNYQLMQFHFDVLLTHAPQLTSFTCDRLYLNQDRSASQCSLKELVFASQCLELTMVANLPTAGLTHLAFQIDKCVSMELPSPSPTLQIWTDATNHPSDMPDLVRRGLLNLTRCPAWQQCGPLAGVDLYQDGHFSPGLQGLILGALAPLCSREVKLTIFMLEGVTQSVTGQLVQQLGGALGSSLKHLVLRRCHLPDDFWPAVWAHLPWLQQLAVSDQVHGSIGREQLMSFCSHAVRPLQLNLGLRLYEAVQGGAQLNTAGGVPQVTVARYAGV
jgi:hypothetical protein